MMKTYTTTVIPGANSCHCVGKQRGEPFCPCEMRARKIFQRNGRWIEPARGETDLGQALPPEFFNTHSEEPEA